MTRNCNLAFFGGHYRRSLRWKVVSSKLLQVSHQRRPNAGKSRMCMKSRSFGLMFPQEKDFFGEMRSNEGLMEAQLVRIEANLKHIFFQSW